MFQGDEKQRKLLRVDRFLENYRETFELKSSGQQTTTQATDALNQAEIRPRKDQTNQLGPMIGLQSKRCCEGQKSFVKIFGSKGN